MIIAKFNGRHDNLGDQLIFACLCEELSKHKELYIWGKEEIPHARGKLRTRHALLKIAQLRMKGTRSALFHPPGAHIRPKVPEKKALSRELQDRFVSLFLSLFQCSLHITGISISEKVDLSQYGRYRTIGVRDSRSKNLLSSYRNDVKLCPDMAFLRPVKKPKTSAKGVVLSFREETPDNGYCTSYKELLLEAIETVLDCFHKHDISTSFFSNVIEDETFHRQLAARTSESKATAYREERPENLDYERFFDEDGIVVSNRLHVLLPAMSEGLLPIALISRNHYKIIDLFTTFGFEKYLIYVEQCQSDIKTQLYKILEQREKLQEENYKALKNLRNQTSDYIQEILHHS